VTEKNKVLLSVQTAVKSLDIFCILEIIKPRLNTVGLMTD